MEAEEADDVADPTRSGQHRLRVRLVKCVVAIFVVWVLLFAMWPARRSDQITIHDYAGQPHTLERWLAHPVVPIPFLEGPVDYVVLGPNQWQIGGRHWAESTTGLLVSPDRRRVAIVRRYEGLMHPHLLIDLASGTAEPFDALQDLDDYHRAGWERHPWPTEGWMNMPPPASPASHREETTAQ